MTQILPMATRLETLSPPGVLLQKPADLCSRCSSRSMAQGFHSFQKTPLDFLICSVPGMLINIILKMVSMSKYTREVLHERRDGHVFSGFRTHQGPLRCFLGISNRGVESAYSSAVLLSIEDLGPSLSDHCVPLGGVLNHHSLRILGIFYLQPELPI